MRVFAFIILASCASHPEACTAGLKAACACNNGESGTQICKDNGTYAACVCAEDASNAGTSGGSSSSGSSGGSSGGDADTKSPPTAQLPFAVIDAAYDTAIDRLIAVSTSPSNAVHIYDPIANQDTSLALPLAPQALSLSPDGSEAVIAHNAYVSTVTLGAMPAITHTYPIATNATSIAHGGNGYAYVFSGGVNDSDFTALYWMALADGTVSQSSDASALFANATGRLQPHSQALYVAQPSLEPDQLQKFDISAGTATLLYSEDFETAASYSTGGASFWFSEDGSRLFTGSGNALRTGPTESSDMTYDGAFANITLVQWITHSATNKTVYLIAAPTTEFTEPSTTPDADTSVSLFEDTYLTLQKTLTLPPLPLTGTALAHGKFVFLSADAQHVFVVAAADPSSTTPDACAIVTF